MPYLPYGKYQGIVSARIHLCNFIPDLIMMHVDGRMATYLMLIRNYIDEKDIPVSLLDMRLVYMNCSVNVKPGMSYCASL